MKKLGQILLSHRALSAQELDQALARQAQVEKPLGEYLLAHGGLHAAFFR